MKKTTLLKITNPLLFILIFVQFFMLFLTNFVTIDGFYLLHKVVGYVFGAVLVIHIVLNWSWIKTSFFKRSK